MTKAKPFSILGQTSGDDAHPHERFSDAARIEARLRETVRGEVRFDDCSRALYATDASNYRQLPIGLVVPRTVEDVILVSNGFSCREQIAQNSPRRAVHLSEVLAGRC